MRKISHSSIQYQKKLAIQKLRQKRGFNNKKLGHLAVGRMVSDFRELLKDRLTRMSLYKISKEINISVVELRKWEEIHYPDVMEAALICRWMKKTVNDYLE